MASGWVPGWLGRLLPGAAGPAAPAEGRAPPPLPDGSRPAAAPPRAPGDPGPGPGSGGEPVRPRKPGNAYNLFFADMRAAGQAAGVPQQWRALPGPAKAAYQARARAAKAAYQAELAAYEACVAGRRAEAATTVRAAALQDLAPEALAAELRAAEVALEEAEAAARRLRREVARRNNRDWARGLPLNVLDGIALALVAAADREFPDLKAFNEAELDGMSPARRLRRAAKQGHDGLLPFSLTCKGWRECQLRTGKMRTRVGGLIGQSGADLKMLMWARDRGGGGGCRDHAAVKLLNWEGGTYFRCYSLCALAAAWGNMEAMLEMRSRLRLPWGVHARVSLSNSTDGPYVVHGDAIMCFIAAREGHLEILKYLRKQEIQWVGREIGYEAAKGGHLHILNFLYADLDCLFENCTCSVDNDMCIFAARGGHVATLKWLKAKGAPFSVHLCSEAAGNGHLRTLQWLRERGCPWDDVTIDAAKEGRHRACLEFALANGCPNPNGVTAAEADLTDEDMPPLEQGEGSYDDDYGYSSDYDDSYSYD